MIIRRIKHKLGLVSGMNRSYFNIRTGLYDRIYLRYRDRVYRYNTVTEEWVDIILRMNVTNAHACAMEIGLHGGVDEDTMNESIKVPELSTFPPGVLSIAVSYIGIDAIYFCGDGTLAVFDQNGNGIHRQTPPIYHMIENSCFSLDPYGNVCTLRPGGHVIRVYTPDGVEKCGWAGNYTMANSMVCVGEWLYITTALEQYEDCETYNIRSGAMIHHKMLDHLNMTGIRCAYKGKLLYYHPLTEELSLYNERIDAVSIGKLGIESELLCMTMSSDESSLYALDEDHLLVIKLPDGETRHSPIWTEAKQAFMNSKLKKATAFGVNIDHVFGTFKEPDVRCVVCSKPTTKVCRCKQIRYCDTDCQRNHRPRHQFLCKLILQCRE
jgi:hypothetical protein